MSPTTQTPPGPGASSKSMAGITQAQKQQLVDNLQLEITDRARKLRAQYAGQARDLRARLELRVNRIPLSLRKRNIQEVMDEHAAKARRPPPPPIPSQKQPTQPTQPVASRSRQPLKRKSDDISGDDKENVPSDNAPEIANPKKRAKTTVAVANSKATRTGSRKAGPAGVLSPKSHNSRTLPHSPLKPSPLSPEKTQPARPISSTQTALSKPTTRAPSRQNKRTGPPSEGRTSEASNTSAGTTIITKPGTRKPPAPKKPAAKTTASDRRPAAAKQQTVTATGAGRTLRKRN